MDYGGRKKKEGIYSPITQNQRHMELIRKIRNESRSNFFTRLLTERTFDTFYKSIVVLANPKTVLNDRYVKKEVKNQVIRADQLVAYIKEQCSKAKEMSSTDSEMRDQAESLLSYHKEVEKDYTKKYQRYLKEFVAEEVQSAPQEAVDMVVTEQKQSGSECPKCGSELVLRTAKKGDNKGNQFFGCSNFPKCRYIQTLE